MDFIAQLVLAEASKNGAVLFCEHPAVAPFAADLAGQRCRSPGAPIQLAECGGRARRMIRMLEPDAFLPSSFVTVVGETGRVRPTIWCDPPSGADLAGFEPIVPGLPRVFAQSTCATQTLHKLRAFASELVSGQIDPWDWIEANLVGRTRIKKLSWATSGAVELQLDALTSVVPNSIADAALLVVDGVACINFDKPLTLRVPLLGEGAPQATVFVRSAGPIFAAPVSPGVVWRSEPVDGGHKVSLETDPIAPWADVTLTGHSGELAGLSLLLARPVQADKHQTDELDRYGDALEAYSTSGFP